jgi:hypothetical protein
MTREEILAAGGVPDLYEGPWIVGCVHGRDACQACKEYDEAQKKLPADKRVVRREIGLVGGTAAMWRTWETRGNGK